MIFHRFLFTLILISGCSSDAENDASVRDGGLQDSGLDAGTNLGPHCLLRVPPNTQMCSMLNTGDVLENHPNRGQITFEEGDHPLYYEQTSFESDWIRQLELVEGIAQPITPGRFTRGGAEGRFNYAQSFSLKNRTYDLEASVLLQLSNGACDQTLVMDEETITDSPNLTITGEYGQQGRSTYNSCTYTEFNINVDLELVIENGDRLALSISMLNPPCPGGMVCAGGVFWGGIRNARFTRGTDERTVNRSFDLGWTALHHGGGQSYLVLFQQDALNGIHGLYLPREATGAEPNEINYLDATLSITDTKQITDRL